MGAPLGGRSDSLRWLPSTIETMTLAPLHLRTTTSTRAAEAPACLRVAGAQAKQEGTGDRHRGLAAQTNLSKASWFGSRTPDLQMQHRATLRNRSSVGGERRTSAD